ncbi:glycoside hydrolase family 15 protein [Streptomyces zingiberis]|uniref:Glycoside hydrolase family 15 protein n=1 Tax=Streptomyces zingiberis TaxID=2053010 RepID=A0ABX1C0D5_9ACTN|nr:glycoside hydrolase family 15 protein [Streptomyces zingiberis]NJQ02098.1 glycoside hydrolase family 15 protein [Streptomyces zingiberis]
MPGRIEDYALIGDLQTAALVGLDGSIDWLCLPRFDSGACFAALLGDEGNGHWRLAPRAAERGAARVSRSYRGESLVLDTVWETPEGSVRVTDFMPQRDRAPDVVRIVEGLSGRVDMRTDIRLRFDFGGIVPWERREDGHHIAVAGPDSVWLRGEGVRWARAGAEGDPITRADFTVAAGERVASVLTWHPSHEPRPRAIDPYEALAHSVADWQEWAARCTYRGPWRQAVLRSLITLKALTYAPTGGIVAATTTSLPEEIGGVRNWDYRYCWLRDAALTLNALVSGGYLAEAAAWRDWLLRAVAGSPGDLQIMYGIAGERRLTEFEAPWLKGYEGSQPVRIGNAAVEQLQLDVYGQVLDTLHVARRRGLPQEEDAWEFQRALMDFLEGGGWREPDEGLWEVRGPRRHFVHSKVMAWTAADRAVRTVAAHPELPGDTARWRAMRAEVHREVCENGYDPDRNTFTQYYGSRGLDAATLLIPETGFLPASDPRVVGTVDAVRRELDHGGLIRRYDPGYGEDGLPGGEGAFLVCSFWLADALLATGRRAEARDLFERLLDLRSDLGLLAEQWDPVAGRQLGNYPQAFSHVGLVNTALALSARDGEAPRGGDGGS